MNRVTTTRRRSGQGGFTLVELMISLVISSIAIAATLALGFALNNTHTEHREMMKTERSARGAMDTLAHAIRSASPGVSTGVLHDLVGCNGSDAITVTNDANSSGSDELFVIYGAGSGVTSLRQAYTDPTVATITNLNVFDGSEFRAGDYVVVTNYDVGILLRVEAVADASPNGWNLTVTPSNACAGLPATWPAGGTGSGFNEGALVVRARMARFYLCPQHDECDVSVTTPRLMMDPDGPNPTGANGGDEDAEPLALGIEDMQITVGADVDGDGIIEENGTTTDEVFYNVSGDPAPPLMTATAWRSIRLTITARSLDTRTNASMSTPTTAEDQSGASVTADAFRRRSISDVIEMRNIVGSP